MVSANVTEQSIVAATAALAGVVYIASPLRPDCLQSVSARVAVGLVAFAIAALVMLGSIAPTVAYAILCLSMASVYIVDLVQEEHARRRRVASLSPRPRADLIPAIWTVVAALSAAMVIPYVFEEGNRVTALIVGACAIVMAAIAWRIASAPLQLLGNDPETERIADRASRARRSYISSALAVGIVFVFAIFVHPASGTDTPVERAVRLLALLVWVGLVLWGTFYVWRLDRLHAKAS
jgi:hypothetical protein